MSAAIPAAPLVPVLALERPLDTIPDEARALYLRRWCSPLEASDFLGYKRKWNPAQSRWEASNSVYRMLKAYADRIAAAPPLGDVTDSLPREGELKGVKNAHWMVDTHCLVHALYPQVSEW